MFRFTRPSRRQIDLFLAEQAALPFTYTAVGATGASPPAGYDCDRARVRLGEGEAVFAAACDALRSWTQFDLGWTAAIPDDTPIETDRYVAVLARAMGVWWLNAARIVYVITTPTQFGFAYGTLPGHVETGEERFLIELDPADGAVWYDIQAFSRPRDPLAKIGYLIVRRLQAKFRRYSALAMQHGVKQRIAAKKV